MFIKQARNLIIFKRRSLGDCNWILSWCPYSIGSSYFQNNFLNKRPVSQTQRLMSESFLIGWSFCIHTENFDENPAKRYLSCKIDNYILFLLCDCIFAIIHDYDKSIPLTGTWTDQKAFIIYINYLWWERPGAIVCWSTSSWCFQGIFCKTLVKAVYAEWKFKQLVYNSMYNLLKISASLLILHALYCNDDLQRRLNKLVFVANEFFSKKLMFVVKVYFIITPKSAICRGYNPYFYICRIHILSDI